MALAQLVRIPYKFDFLRESYTFLYNYLDLKRLENPQEIALF